MAIALYALKNFEFLLMSSYILSIRFVVLQRKCVSLERARSSHTKIISMRQDLLCIIVTYIFSLQNRYWAVLETQFLVNFLSAFTLAVRMLGNAGCVHSRKYNAQYMDHRLVRQPKSFKNPYY